MRHLRVFALFSQHVFQYRARMFIYFLISFLNPFILLMFWKGALKPGEVLNGWTDTTIQSYYILVIVIQALLIAHAEHDVAINDIKQGNLVKELLKPISYLWLKLCDELPWRLTQGTYGVIVIVIFSFFNLKVIVTDNPLILAQAVFISILAFALTFIFKMILGILSFWMTDVYGVLETSDVLFLLLSGALMPFNLLPTWIQIFAQYTPYPYFVYYPVAAFIGQYNPVELFRIMGYEIMWIAGLYLLYRIMWNFGLKKFSGVGQ